MLTPLNRIITALLASLLLTTSLWAASDSEGEEKARQRLAYIPLDPPFVVNFGPDSDTRFLQITVELGTRNPDAIDLIKHNRPAIRNNLVFLFSDQKAAELETRQGKSKLRENALLEAQKVLQAEAGIDGVDTVYFTSFVMQ